MTYEQEIKLELSPAVRLEYLAEGGANVVYRIILPLRDKNALQEIPPSEIPHYGRATPPPTEIEDTDSDLGDQIIETEVLDHKLLRLRKNVRSGRPYREIAHEFHTSVRPLFGACELVDQTLIRVPRSIIQRCNSQLRESERLNVRPSLRRGVYLAEDEPLGMLVTDMTMTNGIHPVSTGNATGNATGHIIELKPKWLLQSPSAPAASRRCRTCALRDMKRTDSSLELLDSNNNNNNKKTSTFQTGMVVPPGKANFCPLDLTSKDPKDLQHTIRRIFLSMPDQQVNIISAALYQHPILQKLLSLQRIHNKVGLDGPSPTGKSEISLSMTLRDCSIFVKISSSVHSNSHSQSHFLDKNGPEIDIRLGDLDLKSSANGKAEYWLSIEKRLIEEGWYLGSQASQSLTDGECALSR